MRTIYILLLMLIFQNAFGQKNENEKLNLSCEKIESRIVDESLYDILSNGKLIFRVNLNDTKIYKVVINNERFYYVSKKLMKKIKYSIKKNKCQNIKINKIDNKDEMELKIIRD